MSPKASLSLMNISGLIFSHNAALSEDEIIRIESKVNEAIESSVPVATSSVIS